MGVKVSVQVGSSVSLGHNRRLRSMCAKDGHIDWERTKDNEILTDNNVRTMYRKLFKDVIDDYNKNQKEKRRKITNYYNKIKEDKQKHNLYEVIVQVGSVDNPIDEKTAKEILKDYYQKFIKENKNLVVTGAYIHMDEATPHMHIDFIPVAEFDRGLKKRNALNKAFEEIMGSKSKNPKQTAQIAWQARQREILRDISAEYEIETDEVEHGKRTKHLDTPQYKEVMAIAEKDLAEIKRKQEELLEKIEKKLYLLNKKIPWDYQDGITQKDWTNYFAQIAKEPERDYLRGVDFEYIKVPVAMAKNLSNYALADRIKTQAFRATEELEKLKKELTEIMGSKPIEAELHEVNQAKLKLENDFWKLERKYKMMEGYLAEKGHMEDYEAYQKAQEAPDEAITEEKGKKVAPTKAANKTKTANATATHGGR